MRQLWIITLIVVFFGVFTIKTRAEEARVVKIAEEKEIEVEGQKQWYQKLELVITRGGNEGRMISIDNGDLPVVNTNRYTIDDRLMIEKVAGGEGYQIVDYIRTDALALLAILFAVLILITTKKYGLTSMVGMLFTFGVIFYYLLPRILAGDDPILTAVLASGVIIPVSFYLAHGLNKKTTVAIIGSLLGLVITSVMAMIFINIGKLTGLASEEAGLVASSAKVGLNMKGVLLAGIIIGTLGVLDDITISQAAIVEELSKTAKLKTGELFSKAMRVGRDHITSMVNTLVLAYTGASMPLLLIFIDNPRPVGEIFNHEFLAEEIIRTLIGSIGLVLAVPITTIIAAYWFETKNK